MFKKPEQVYIEQTLGGVMKRFLFIFIAVSLGIAGCGQGLNEGLTKLDSTLDTNHNVSLITGVTKQEGTTKKLSSELNRLTLGSTKTSLVGKIVGGDESTVDVFIKTTDIELTKQKLVDNGASVRSTIGDILTANVPNSLISQIAEWEEVVYVEASKPLSYLNSNAIQYSGIDAVRTREDIPSENYYGSGVIVGIIDSGIDLRHPAFFNAEGQSRILYVWDQSDDAGTGPTELESTYGTECDNANIMSNTCAMTDDFGHGTHVAGTSAGMDSSYGGVAPEASLIAVKFRDSTMLGDIIGATTFSTSVCDAAYYIFKKADALGMPAVINISLGSSSGPHDGTSLFEQCLDNLVAEKPSRFIVAAAGNSSRSLGGAHIGYEITPEISRSSVLVPIADYPFYHIDIWENQGCNMDVGVIQWSTSSGAEFWTDWVHAGESVSGSFGDVADVIVDRTETESPLNSKHHTQILLLPNTDFELGEHFFSFVFSGTCSGFNAWANFEDTQLFSADTGVFPLIPIGDIEYLAGNNISTVSTPSTAKNILSVASYNTRMNWTDSLDAIHEDLDNTLLDLSIFSSNGPALTEDQGQKPNLTAPGAWIISAMSADADVLPEEVINDYFQIMQGTSMASPHVAGIVALLLQINPELGYQDIMNFLQTTTFSDDFVLTTPNNRWGFGKVSAGAAVQKLVDSLPPAPEPEPEPESQPQPQPEPEPVAADNPAPVADETVTTASSSGGGCSILLHGNNNTAACLILISLVGLGLFRKRKQASR